MFKGFEVEDKQLHEMSSGGNQEKTAPTKHSSLIRQGNIKGGFLWLV